MGVRKESCGDLDAGGKGKFMNDDKAFYLSFFSFCCCSILFCFCSDALGHKEHLLMLIQCV